MLAELQTKFEEKPMKDIAPAPTPIETSCRSRIH
jgi:hypothetical protein